MTRFTTLAVAALFSTAALAAPDSADARTRAAPFAEAPAQRVALRQMDADAGVALKRAMRKRARKAGHFSSSVEALSAEQVMLKRKMRRIQRKRGLKPIAR